MKVKLENKKWKTLEKVKINNKKLQNKKIKKRNTFYLRL